MLILTKYDFRCIIKTHSGFQKITGHRRIQMIIGLRILRIVFAVIQVLFLIGAVLVVTGCSGGPNAPSQSTIVVPAGPSVLPGTQSFWVGIEPNPIVMSVGSEASIRIDGSFDWYDLVVRAEPADAFRVQPWGISVVNLKVLRRTTGKLIVEVYGSGNRLAKAVATINVQ